MSLQSCSVCLFPCSSICVYIHPRIICFSHLFSYSGIPVTPLFFLLLDHSDNDLNVFNRFQTRFFISSKYVLLFSRRVLSWSCCNTRQDYGQLSSLGLILKLLDLMQKTVFRPDFLFVCVSRLASVEAADGRAQTEGALERVPAETTQWRASADRTGTKPSSAATSDPAPAAETRLCSTQGERYPPAHGKNRLRTQLLLLQTETNGPDTFISQGTPQTGTFYSIQFYILVKGSLTNSKGASSICCG